MLGQISWAMADSIMALPPMCLMQTMAELLSVSTRTTLLLIIEAEDFSDRATAVSSRQLLLLRLSLFAKNPLDSSLL